MTKQAFFLFLILSAFNFGAKAQRGSYSKLITIKQPYHSFNATDYQDTRKGFQRVNGMKISDNGKFLLISYAENPTTIAIYEIGNWERVGVYRIFGNGVELNSSYYSDDMKKLFVKYDRFSPHYKVIEFDTGYIREMVCERAPKGCYVADIVQDKKEIYTSNMKFYMAVSKNDASDVDIFIKRTR
jgi:hypothetical protein